MPPVLHHLRPSHLLKFFCHDQVKLLLERMDSHPDEFVYDNRKWINFIPPVLKEENVHPHLSQYRYFTLIEKLAIYIKCRQLIIEVARPFAYGLILETIVEEGTEPFVGEIK